VLKSCPPEFHRECLGALRCEIGDAPVYPVGMMAAAKEKFSHLVTDPHAAEIILVVGDGLIHPEIGDLIEKYREEKRILFLSPSTVGVSALLGCEHWCPFGKI
ncbi:MAG TPA: hypothetical protein PK272_09130, partial [Methanoregulaceae archaeon]|nr:hypothetical protein [Methanoregulaceae archaeon]